MVVILPSLGLFFCFHGELELESGPWSASYVAFVSCFSGHKLSSRRVEGAAAGGGGRWRRRRRRTEAERQHITRLAAM